VNVNPSGNNCVRALMKLRVNLLRWTITQSDKCPYKKKEIWVQTHTERRVPCGGRGMAYDGRSRLACWLQTQDHQGLTITTRS
jgi:hypothetical protein